MLQMVTQSVGQVTVPDLPADRMIKLIDKLFEPSYLDPDFVGWDFMRGERGKTFDVKVWTPDNDLASANEVRSHFKKRNNFRGNTAALLAWFAKCDHDGRYATVPENKHLYMLGRSGCLPQCIRTEGDAKLHLFRSVNGPCVASEGWTFLGFKEANAT
ncbi:MAG: hypothetical protein WCK01_05345 [Candidatus Uhrbacteria bacterium]